MAISWGSTKKGARIGIDPGKLVYNAAKTQARYEGATIYMSFSQRISDSVNRLSWSGGAWNDGSKSNISISGTSSKKKLVSVTGQWQTLGSSVKKFDMSASFTGLEYPGTLSKTLTVSFPAYVNPAPPPDPTPTTPIPVIPTTGKGKLTGSDARGAIQAGAIVYPPTGAMVGDSFVVAGWHQPAGVDVPIALSGFLSLYHFINGIIVLGANATWAVATAYANGYLSSKAVPDNTTVGDYTTPLRVDGAPTNIRDDGGIHRYGLAAAAVRGGSALLDPPAFRAQASLANGSTASWFWEELPYPPTNWDDTRIIGTLPSTGSNWKTATNVAATTAMLYQTTTDMLAERVGNYRPQPYVVNTNLAYPIYQTDDEITISGRLVDPPYGGFTNVWIALLTGLVAGPSGTVDSADWDGACQWVAADGTLSAGAIGSHSSSGYVTPTISQIASEFSIDLPLAALTPGKWYCAVAVFGVDAPAWDGSELDPGTPQLMPFGVTSKPSTPTVSVATATDDLSPTISWAASTPGPSIPATVLGSTPAVPGAAATQSILRYEVAVIDPATGQELWGQDDVSASATSVSVPAATPWANGKTYTAQVRAIQGTNPGNSDFGTADFVISWTPPTPPDIYVTRTDGEPTIVIDPLAPGDLLQVGYAPCGTDVNDDSQWSSIYDGDAPLVTNRVSVAHNLCTNPNFEVDTSGWFSVSLSNFTTTNSWAASGNQSLQYIPLNTSAYCYYETPITPGAWYAVAAQCNMANPQSGNLPAYPRNIRIRFFNQYGTVISEVYSNTAPNQRGVHLLAKTVQAPYDATTMTVYFLFAGPVFIDAVGIYEGIERDDVIGQMGRGYFDGSNSSDYYLSEWDGAANASASTLYETGIVAVNECTNPGFDAPSTQGWTASASNIAAVDDWSADGSYSLKITPTGYLQSNAYIQLPAQGGRVYGVRATIFQPQTAVGPFDSSLVRSVGIAAYPGPVDNPSYSSMSWRSPSAENIQGQQVVSLMTQTLSMETRSIRVSLYNGSKTPSDLVYFDSIEVVSGASATEVSEKLRLGYFDGETNPDTNIYANAWIGDDNLSVSTLTETDLIKYSIVKDYEDANQFRARRGVLNEAGNIVWSDWETSACIESHGVRLALIGVDGIPTYWHVASAGQGIVREREVSYPATGGLPLVDISDPSGRFGEFVINCRTRDELERLIAWTDANPEFDIRFWAEFDPAQRFKSAEPYVHAALSAEPSISRAGEVPHQFRQVGLSWLEVGPIDG